MKTKYTLCDFRCPLHTSCARFCDGMDKTKTYHYGASPYNEKKNGCERYEQSEPDIKFPINGH